jgi:hypothetical protein
MQLRKTLIVTVALLGFGMLALAETVHQSLPADKLYTGDGGNAVEKGQVEAKKVVGAESAGGQIARVKGSMGQWGFVVGWFGVPTPAGKSIVRVRLYNEPGGKVAKYFLYTRNDKGSNGIGELKIPANTPEDTFVNVDVPVNASAEWSGLVIKKAEKNDLPSPWIDTISIVLPD